MDLGELRAKLTATREQFKAEIQGAKKDLKELGLEGTQTGEKFKGMNRNFVDTKKLAEELEKDLKKLGSEMTAIGKKLSIGLTAPLVAFGGAAMAVADQYDKAMNIIQVGTGATGDALLGLGEDFNEVFTSIPTDAELAANAVSNLNTLTGATGPVLQNLTRNVLEASRVLKEDGVANSQAFGQALQQWRIPAEQGTIVLDSLFKSTQDYGIGLGEIISQLNEYGSVLQNANFSVEESADFLGRLNAAGISVSRVMPGLNAAFRNWAKEGKNAKAELQNIITSMQVAETHAQALAIATDVFGAEGAQRITTAIRTGALPALNELGTALEGTEGLVKQTGEANRTLGESFQLVRNQAAEALQPLGEVLINLTQAGLPHLERLVERLRQASERFSNMSSEAQLTVIGIGIFVAAIGPAIMLLGSLTTGLASIVRILPGLITLIRGLTTSQLALNVAMAANPIGLVVAGLGALGIALYAVNREQKALTEATEANRQKTQELASEYDQLNAKLRTLEEDTEEAKNAKVRMAEITNELIRINPSIVDAYNAQTGAVKSMTSAIKEATQARLDELKAREAMLDAESRTINPIKSFQVTRELYTVRAQIHELEKTLSQSINKQLHEEEMAKLDYLTASNAWRNQSPQDSGGSISTGSRVSGVGASSSLRQATQIDLVEQQKRLREEAYRNAISLENARYEHVNSKYNDERKLLEDHVARLEEIRDKHKNHLEANEQEMLQFETTILRKKQELEHSNFQFSIDWIEERKYYNELSLEEELAAWQRVHDRYMEGTEERKRAAREVYRVQQELNRQMVQEELELNRQRIQELDRVEKKLQQKMADSIRASKDAEIRALDERKRNIEESYQHKLDRISEEERRELDSLDRRKRELQEFYDSQLDSIDNEERAEERKELLNEIEKYRLATSKQGRDKLKELQDRLLRLDREEQRRNLQRQRDEELRNIDDRSRDLNDFYDKQKENIQDQRDEELRSLDDRRRAIESYYSDLERAFRDYSGDISEMEKLLQDERTSLFSDANNTILSDARKFINEYNRIMSQRQEEERRREELEREQRSPSTPKDTTPSTPSKPTNPLGMSDEDFRRYVDFKKQWEEGNEQQKAHAEQYNAALRQKYGITSDTYSYSDLAQYLHTGGIAGLMDFQNPSELMPDEIRAILQKEEFVFQKGQLGSLLEQWNK